MKLKDRYDCVVVGDHPGAILAGLLVNRLGLTVLMIPQCGSQGKVYSKDKMSVVDPESSWFLGLGEHRQSQGLWRELLSKLEISDTEKLVDSKNLNSAVWCQGSHFVVSKELQDWDVECDWNFTDTHAPLKKMPQIFARYSEPMLQFWQKYPQMLRKQDRRSKLSWASFTRSSADIRSYLFEPKTNENISRTSQDKKWMNQRLSRLDAQTQAWIGSLWSLQTEERAHARDLFDLLHLTTLGQTGRSLQGGVWELRSFLTRTAQERGVLVLDHPVSLEIRLNQDRISHLLLGEEKKQVDVGSLMVGCSVDQMKNLLQKKIKLDELCKPSGWFFTIAARVSRDFFSDSHARRFAIHEEGSPVLYIEVKTVEEYGLEGNSKDDIVFLRTTLPFESESLDPGFQNRVAKRMLKAAAQYFPLLDEKCKNVFPVLDSADEEFSQVYGFPSLEYIPENLRIYLNPGVGPETNIKGAFIVSGESYPQLGTWGSAVAAVEASHWLALQSGIPGVFA